MKLYYIEKKTYFRGSNGLEYQMADGGETPILYHSLEKALARASKIVAIETILAGGHIIIDSAHHPASHGLCKYACRIGYQGNTNRMEIRLWEIETIV